jgi:hypothetical protein
LLYRLTENVFVQDSMQAALPPTDWSELGGELPADQNLLSHAVNFYRPPTAERDVIRATTQSVARALGHSPVPVRHLGVAQDNEQDSIPPGFEPCIPLRRTIGHLKRFAVPRPLPLLFDILDAAAPLADPAGYFFLSNSDICLNGNFYSAVIALLDAGADCLLINRRTVGALQSYGAQPELGELEAGKQHPGFDCFVFPAAWIGRFVKSESCVGMPNVMRPLLYNLVALSNRMLILRDAHLTFHYGDDMVTKIEKYADYHAHNNQQAAAALNTLCSLHPQHRQRLQAFCAAHGEQFQPPGGNAT